MHAVLRAGARPTFVFGFPRLRTSSCQRLHVLAPQAGLAPQEMVSWLQLVLQLIAPHGGSGWTHAFKPGRRRSAATSAGGGKLQITPASLLGCS